MAKYETNSLGYKIVLSGPGTVEEFDAAAGKSGAALEEAVFGVIYRGTLPDFHDAFAKLLEEQTGEKRKVDEVATAKAKSTAKEGKEVKDVLETVATYNKRVRAMFADDKETLASFAVLAQQAADSVTVDPSPSARAASINKGDLAKAESILTLSDDEVEAKVAKILAVVPDFDLEREENGRPTKSSLARAIGAFVAASL